MKDLNKPHTNKPYALCVDWVQDGDVHYRHFTSDNHTKVFDQAFLFASTLHDVLGIPMGEIGIIDNSDDALPVVGVRYE